MLMLQLLRAGALEAVRGALNLKSLGCWCDKADDQQCGRISLSSLRHTLSNLNLVTVLTAPHEQKPGAVRCTCAAFLRDGQCVHEGFCRVPEGDHSIPLQLKHFTSKILPHVGPEAAAAGSNDSGRPVKTRGAAWSTKSDLKDEAAAKTKKLSCSASLDTPRKAARRLWLLFNLRLQMRNGAAS